MSPDAAGAAEVVAVRTGVQRHDVAVVLGSGWAPAVQALGDPLAEVAMAEIPGFTAPSADGHRGQVLSLMLGRHRVLVFVGRIHGYEGHPLGRVAHPVRTACAAGAEVVILTNAAGGLHPDYRVGQPVLISDHLNLTARSPLVGPEFVDLVDAYSPRLRALARTVDPSLAEGVYAAMPGPQYETPAEIRMLRTLGADLVGMSTVHETIAARGDPRAITIGSALSALGRAMKRSRRRLDAADARANAARTGGLRHRRDPALYRRRD